MYDTARYYDPAVGRFISADTVVPGNASGSMNGVAVKPLTVGFHETPFLAKLNQENQLGFWFQLGDQERQQAGSPWGPANPQALNRYSYVQNNALKYTDPSGHWTIQISLGFQAFSMGGARVSASLAFDDKGNWAILYTTGGGGYVGSGVNVGPGVTATNADTVYDLEGVSVAFGGQVGEGAGVNGEIEFFKSNGVNYVGVSLGGGAVLEFPLAEVHGAVDNSTIVASSNYMEDIVEWLKFYLWARDKGLAP